MYYIGPVDGHNVGDLVTIFEKVKALPAPGPVLIHIVTEKGKGYTPAELAADKMHGNIDRDNEFVMFVYLLQLHQVPNVVSYFRGCEI